VLRLKYLVIHSEALNCEDPRMDLMLQAIDTQLGVRQHELFSTTRTRESHLLNEINHIVTQLSY